MHPKIKDYQITDKLAESRSTRVCRAHRIANGESVVLKILKPDAATRGELARFRREFEMTSRLDLPGIVKALVLEDNEEGLTIVFQDIGGQSLDRLLEQAPLSLTTSLKVAMALVDTVGLLHKQQIIHKDINPSHVIFNSTTRQVNLIGFGLADEAPERSVTPLPPSALEGTLAYISPEQTGRMNRPVDYRTDFYSLGVTFYQMLTGKLPFEADDALGMVHSHIAKTPAPPHELKPDIPEMVSLIVIKLMSKMADDRYQSAFGLKADLEKCWRGLRDEGAVRDFEPGLEDFPDQLRFPDRLYGRAGELDQLLHAFEQVSHGERELLFVAGYAGVGKTRLVREIHKTVIEKQGYFIEGKFDQLQQNVPYSAWIQALGGFVKYILMEGEAGLVQWKKDILSALRGIGKVLTDVIPNLEVVIGVQPDVTPLGPVEAQNRFNYVFLEFIKAIATSEHPLAVFLDDLQWIDGASLNLLETLMSSAGVSNILVIGAYRDNEVEAFHPLIKTVAALRNEAARVDLLALKDLSEITVNELIADIVYRSPVETTDLTHLVYAKTGGNPFFLRQTLRTLVEKQAIFFDIESRQWQWDISILEGMDITDNVADLMLGKIRLLSPETQRLLPLAACIGFTFDLTNLGIIAEQPEDAVMAGLRPALREGLAVPRGDEFLFVHDRVQQAAYSLIPAKEKKQVHLKIGRLLLKHTQEHDQEEQLFTVVDHLNIGAELLKERNDKLELARLNLRAGSKAKDSAAFAAAAKYFDAGVAILGDKSWQSDYDLALELHSRAAEVESLLGGFERTDQLFAVVTGNARTAEDMVDVYLSQMHSYLSQGKLQEAVDTALEGYERLGLSLPGYPTDEDIARALAETKAQYADIPIEDLINLPKMTDPNKLAIMRIHKKAGPVAYISRPPLVLLIIFSEAGLSIKYGNAAESPNSYSAYGFVLCGLYREYDEGYRFANLALALLEAGDSSQIMAKTMDMIGGHLWHFRHHLKETLPYLEKGYQFGLKTGDFENAGYDAEFCCSNSYLAGVELPQLEQLIDFYGESVRRIRAETAASIIAPYWQAVKNLLSTSGDPCILAGERFNQEKMLPVYEQKHNSAGLAAFYVNRLVLCYLFENYEQALESAELAENHQGGMLAMFTHSASIFYDSLARIQVYAHRTPSEQAQILEKVSANQQVMEGLADSAPMNFRHKFSLVEAERLRLAGEGMAALDYYDQAISLAGENGYIQEEALANELAARFCLGKGKEKFAQAYMKEAHRCYESWGAVRKVQDLEEQYGYLSQLPPPGDKAETALELLDLSTLMKATHAISSEIEMDRLLDQVMHIVIENAGAESGFLLLEHDGVWQITAIGGVGAAEFQIPLPVSIEESDVVAQSVVRFVARTKQSVVLDDAAGQGEFINDPHIKQERTRSLFCAPLLSRGKLIGILYLENNLTTQAFTAERIQLLEMLLSQAAISLENARIYGALRNSEEKYRRIVDTAAEGIWALGPDTRTTLINTRMTEILGYSAAEMIGRPMTDFMLEEDVPDHLRRMEAHRKGASENYERRFRSKDGRTIWTFISATGIFDDEHNFQGAFGMIGDITERKQAQAKLAEEQALLRCLIDSVSDLIFIKDLNGVYQGCNKAGEAFVGMPECEQIGKSDFDFFDREKAEEIRQADRRVFEEGKPLRIEEWVTGRDGRRLLMDTLKAPYYAPDGELLGLVGIGRDITERKRAEEELRKHRDHLEELVGERTAELTIAKNAAEEARRLAEAASQAKSVFLANMSHELRTPLNAILGYAQILQRRPLDPDVINALNTVQRSGEHLLTLINDILDIARIEAGRLELLPTPIHFPTFLDHIASIIHSRAQAKGLTFSLERLNDLPVGVQADETRLRQVLLNLLDNAVKFTEEGSVTLCVKCEDVKREFTHHVSRITFQVQDTGIGIPPDQLERIFQPFEQVRDVHRQTKGTGLGLAISRQLVRLMGGDLQVESPPSIPPTGGEVKGGPGSTFWFEIVLPVTEMAVEAVQPPERAITGYRGPRRTVLVVDDVPSNRAILVDLLQPLGFEVIEAADGQQALHLAQKLRPDLILMDRWMPGLDGFEAAQRMRQIPELRKASIVTVSASVSQEDQAQSRAVGIDAFLPKPVSWPRLAVLLQECLVLEWEYEERRSGGAKEQEGEFPPAPLVPPPTEEMEILLDLARRGDMRAIRERAAHIETLGEQYVPFARRLHELAESFEERQIRALIERYMEEG